MIIKLLKIKKNEHKKKAKNIYQEIIKQIDIFCKSSNFPLVKNFNTTFELTVFLIFILFFTNKNNKNTINQEILNIFISDLDYSFRKKGISEMSIGKYVKKYVNKIYFRFKKFDKIFQINKYNDFQKFILKLQILSSIEKNNEFSLYLYNYANKCISEAKLRKNSSFLFNNLN